MSNYFDLNDAQIEYPIYEGHLLTIGNFSTWSSAREDVTTNLTRRILPFFYDKIILRVNLCIEVNLTQFHSRNERMNEPRTNTEANSTRDRAESGSKDQNV